MRARAPASSANLGPGFDTLAVALDCYVSVEVEPADLRSGCTPEGEGAGLFDDASHLAARVVTEVLGHDRFAVTVRSQIPVACAEAGVICRAASRRLRRPRAPTILSPWPHRLRRPPRERGRQRLRWPVGGDHGRGHSGLRAAAPQPGSGLRRPGARPRPGHTRSEGCAPRHGQPQRRRFQSPGPHGFCWWPGWPIRLTCVPPPRQDRIHQPARSALFPEAPALLEALVEAGALAACWSGAGPTLLGFVTRDRQEQVRTDAASALAASGVPGRVVALEADRRGLVYGDEAIVDL